MQTNQFEQAFSDFLDRREYDQAENALFSMVRIAFLAGWKAAGGEAPPPQKLFRLVHKDVKPLRARFGPLKVTCCRKAIKKSKEQ